MIKAKINDIWIDEWLRLNEKFAHIAYKRMVSFNPLIFQALLESEWDWYVRNN